jgi:hypothetical protein
MPGSIFERYQQRLVEQATVCDRVVLRLLGERVRIVVGGLKGDERPDRSIPVGCWGQCRECGGTLDIAPLGAVGLERETSQFGIGDFACAPTPIIKLALYARKYAQPVAAGG